MKTHAPKAPSISSRTPLLLTALVLLFIPVAYGGGDGIFFDHKIGVSGSETSLEQRPEKLTSVKVVEQFSLALKKGDADGVASHLHDEVLIVESGGVERSKEEYVSHHLSSDIDFMREKKVVVIERHAKELGETAIVVTRSYVGSNDKGKRKIMSETMVLSRTNGGWKIVHVHWSNS